VAGHPHLQVIAKALLSVRAVLRSEFAAFEKTGTQDGAIRYADTAADVDAGSRPDRGADLCQRDSTIRPGSSHRSRQEPISG